MEKTKKKILSTLKELKKIAKKQGDGLYGDLDMAIEDIDALIESQHTFMSVSDITILVAPTGNLHELAIDTGWANEFEQFARKIETLMREYQRSQEEKGAETTALF